MYVHVAIDDNARMNQRLKLLGLRSAWKLLHVHVSSQFVKCFLQMLYLFFLLSQDSLPLRLTSNHLLIFSAIYGHFLLQALHYSFSFYSTMLLLSDCYVPSSKSDWTLSCCRANSASTGRKKSVFAITLNERSS